MNTVIIALGSNLGNREFTLRRAVYKIGKVIRIVRISAIHETKPVDSPPGSPDFLNMVVAGHTSLSPEELLEKLQSIESRLGRRRTVKNAPRTIDLDLVLYGARRMRTRSLILPHPRYLQRSFVMDPLRELGLDYLVP